jgi:hypothetical protein
MCTHGLELSLVIDMGISCGIGKGNTGEFVQKKYTSVNLKLREKMN